jgi:hypothetical protein
MKKWKGCERKRLLAVVWHCSNLCSGGKWAKPQELHSQDTLSSGRASNPWPGMLIKFFGRVKLCRWCTRRKSAGREVGLCSIGGSVIDGVKLESVGRKDCPNLTFIGRYIVTYFCSKSNQMHQFLKFILFLEIGTVPIVNPNRCNNFSNLFYFCSNTLTCFGRSFRPSSAVQDCTCTYLHWTSVKNRYWQPNFFCVTETSDQEPVHCEVSHADGSVRHHSQDIQVHDEAVLYNDR